MNAVGNASDLDPQRSVFNPNPIPYFLGDWSLNNFYGHSPPADLIGDVVSYMENYVQKVLVNPLVKLATEKVLLG